MSRRDQTAAPAGAGNLDAVLASLGDSVHEMPALAAAYLFGSAAHGQTTSLSDVDVALLFAHGCNSRERRRIAADLASRVVRSHRGPPLDVRDLEELPLLIQGHVLTQGRLLASNDDVRRVGFEVAVRMRYFDFLPFHRADIEEGLQALRRKHLGG